MSLEGHAVFAFVPRHARRRTAARVAQGQANARVWGSPERIASHVEKQPILCGSHESQRSGPA